MGFFDFLKREGIDKGVEEFKATGGAVLLDVRTPQEYREGRIPGSKNVPLQDIESAASVVPDKSTPLFVYCYSGARSRSAAAMLQRMGYTAVKNIGGIASYTGQIER